jgi:tetratricopeptide (TPR) repeat protein
MGEWDPQEEYWGEEDEPFEEWEQTIIAQGKRQRFEMEQVIPGADPEDFDSDPIIDASERNDAGDHAGARAILMNLLAQDLRCLDAHAHLGNHELDYRPEQALRHYETGTAIGDLSLGPRFRDALPWGLIDNRPYLRCLHGKGLALWRIGRMQDAAAIFQRLLRLNPSDNQGARFCLAAVETGKAWEP